MRRCQKTKGTPTEAPLIVACEGVTSPDALLAAACHVAESVVQLDVSFWGALGRGLRRKSSCQPAMGSVGLCGGNCPWDD